MTDTKITASAGTAVEEKPTLLQLEVEIKFHLNQAGAHIIEVGKRLIQAKELVAHGGWANWLKENFNLTERSARRFMQVAERFGKTDIDVRFNPTQMIAMLALPEGKEEEFINAKAAEGTPVEDMTIKALREEIASWKKQSEKSEFANKELEKQIAAGKKKLDDLKRELDANSRASDNTIKWLHEDLESLKKENAAYKADNKRWEAEFNKSEETRLSLTEDLGKYKKLAADYEIKNDKLKAAKTIEVAPRDYESLKEDNIRLQQEVKELQERPVEVAIEKPADYELLKQENADFREREKMLPKIIDYAKNVLQVFASIQASPNKVLLNAAVEYLRENYGMNFKQEVAQIFDYVMAIKDNADNYKPAEKEYLDPFPKEKPLYAYGLKSNSATKDAAPAGYVKVDKGEQKIKGVGTVFGIVYYEQPLTMQQVTAYDLATLPQNSNITVEVETLDYDTVDKELKNLLGENKITLPQIRNLVASYGVKQFNDVPQDKLPELLEKARQF